jgi:transmembrane sensor
VANEFNRYNTRQLIIVDPTIANTRITGNFTTTNPTSLIRALESLNKFTIHETPGRLEISGQ